MVSREAFDHERAVRRSNDQKIEELRAKIVELEQLSESVEYARDEALAEADLARRSDANNATARKELATDLEALAEGSEVKTHLASVVKGIIKELRASLAVAEEKLEAETHACTKLHCDVSNALSRYRDPPGCRLQDLLQELEAISQSNPHAVTGGDND